MAHHSAMTVGELIAFLSNKPLDASVSIAEIDHLPEEQRGVDGYWSGYGGRPSWGVHRLSDRTRLTVFSSTYREGFQPRIHPDTQPGDGVTIVVSRI